MAYSFPRAGTVAAQLASTPHAKELLDNPSAVPAFNEARTRARNWLKTPRSGANGLYQTCMLANDDIAIVFFGPRTAQRVIWNFGHA
jgi:hypothetical protein